jgi:hypothetical protein
LTNLLTTDLSVISLGSLLLQGLPLLQLLGVREGDAIDSLEQVRAEYYTCSSIVFSIRGEGV